MTTTRLPGMRSRPPFASHVTSGGRRHGFACRLRDLTDHKAPHHQGHHQPERLHDPDDGESVGADGMDKQARKAQEKSQRQASFEGVRRVPVGR
ncbi:MAG: hypothetical protein HY267_06265, partial [Deltaproteobacteria bacterium]|nr:hypothetical protein [Deltaproteobacteria bacterium]